MKTALVFGRSDELLLDLDRCLSNEGLAVAVARTQEELLDGLRQGSIHTVILETRREAFVDLLKTAIRMAPEASVYLIDSGSVFCRYPLWIRQPDIVSALRKAEVRISDRLFTTRPMAGPAPPVEPAAASADMLLI